METKYMSMETKIFAVQCKFLMNLDNKNNYNNTMKHKQVRKHEEQTEILQQFDFKCIYKVYAAAGDTMTFNKIHLCKLFKEKSTHKIHRQFSSPFAPLFHFHRLKIMSES